MRAGVREIRLLPRATVPVALTQEEDLDLLIGGSTVPGRTGPYKPSDTLRSLEALEDPGK